MQTEIVHKRKLDAPLRTKNRRNTQREAGIFTVLCALAVLFTAPFIWLISTALKTPVELAAFPIRWFPTFPQWENFLQAVTFVDYWHYAADSLLISSVYTILVTFTSALVGFAFARLQGKGKRPLLIIMLSTIMLPPILTVIPTFVLFSRIGLVNTYWPWVLWGLSSTPFLSFLFRQFFSAIPQEIEEAAILDGCSYWRMFWQIFLPLSVPVLVTAAILSFTSVWGDYITPSIFLSQNNTTLSVAIASNYVNEHGTLLVNIAAAGAIIYVFPVLVLFFMAQRFFVRGIATTGLKG